MPVLIQDVVHFIVSNFDLWLLWTECSRYALALYNLFNYVNNDTYIGVLILSSPMTVAL